MNDNMWVMLSQIDKQDQERRFREALRVHRSRNGRARNTAFIRLFTRNLHLYRGQAAALEADVTRLPAW